MQKFTIINISDSDIILMDSDSNKYIKAIQFMNTSYYPRVGDLLTLSEDIIEENNIFTYGDIYNEKKDDIIKIETNNNVIYLQRYYG